jgi:hypothetical protein
MKAETEATIAERKHGREVRGLEKRAQRAEEYALKGY